MQQSPSISRARQKTQLKLRLPKTGQFLQETAPTYAIEWMASKTK